MKITTCNVDIKPKFTPKQINITLESPEEVALLWAKLNLAMKTVKDLNKYYWVHEYLVEMGDCATLSSRLFDAINDIAVEAGFKE